MFSSDHVGLCQMNLFYSKMVAIVTLLINISHQVIGVYFRNTCCAHAPPSYASLSQRCWSEGKNMWVIKCHSWTSLVHGKLEHQIIRTTVSRMHIVIIIFQEGAGSHYSYKIYCPVSIRFILISYMHVVQHIKFYLVCLLSFSFWTSKIPALVIYQRTSLYFHTHITLIKLLVLQKLTVPLN